MVMKSLFQYIGVYSLSKFILIMMHFRNWFSNLGTGHWMKSSVVYAYQLAEGSSALRTALKI
jgi:hypothetical protein